jgi:hypothetical protein
MRAIVSVDPYSHPADKNELKRAVAKNRQPLRTPPGQFAEPLTRRSGFACYFLDFEGGGGQPFKPDASFVQARMAVPPWFPAERRSSPRFCGDVDGWVRWAGPDCAD